MSINLQELQRRLDGVNTSMERSGCSANPCSRKPANYDWKIDELSDVSIHSVTTTHDLSNTVLELEGYSRKQCLIFNSIEVGRDQGLSTALNLLNNHLRINSKRQDIMACHPVGPGEVAPLIVKFVYHHHRDNTWARKGHLRGLKQFRSIYLPQRVSCSAR